MANHRKYLICVPILTKWRYHFLFSSMILCPSLLYLAAGFLSFDFQHLLIRHLAIFIERLSRSVTKILTAVNETRENWVHQEILWMQGKMSFRNGANMVMSHAKILWLSCFMYPWLLCFYNRFPMSKIPFSTFIFALLA